MLLELLLLPPGCHPLCFLPPSTHLSGDKTEAKVTPNPQWRFQAR